MLKYHIWTQMTNEPEPRKWRLRWQSDQTICSWPGSRTNSSRQMIIATTKLVRKRDTDTLTGLNGACYDNIKGYISFFTALAYGESLIPELFPWAQDAHDFWYMKGYITPYSTQLEDQLKAFRFPDAIEWYYEGQQDRLASNP